jgi:hypothetical protein
MSPLQAATTTNKKGVVMAMMPGALNVSNAIVKHQKTGNSNRQHPRSDLLSSNPTNILQIIALIIAIIMAQSTCAQICLKSFFYY